MARAASLLFLILINSSDVQCFALTRIVVSKLPTSGGVHVPHPVPTNNIQKNDRSKVRAKKSGDNNVDDDKERGMMKVPVNFGLVAADLFAVALACQLMGLLDILNDADFWSNGGWFQPMPAAPPSLPALVQRFSINSAILLIVSIPFRNPNQQERKEPEQQLIALLSKTAPLFLVARLLAGIATTVFVSPDGLDATIVECLREFYFVTVTVGATRYIYYSLYKA